MHGLVEQDASAAVLVSDVGLSRLPKKAPMARGPDHGSCFGLCHKVSSQLRSVCYSVILCRVPVTNSSEDAMKSL